MRWEGRIGSPATAERVINLPKKTQPKDDTQAQADIEPGTPPPVDAPQAPSSDADPTSSSELESVREQLMRTMAEFQNFRKRVQQEKSQLQQYAIEALVLDLIPVLDNFERTNSALKKGAGLEALQTGLDAVERQLRKVLEDRSVTRVPAKGSPFDPDIHEAVVTEDSIWFPDGTVLEELEPGYKLRDRLIRPARVKVSRKP